MTTQTNGAKPTVSHVKATFQSMLAPTSKPVSRKAWGIDVSTIWLPYFTAARVTGAVHELELSDADLGAPFRLRRDKDTGEVKFSQSGRPMFTVTPNLNDMVNRARENYIARLLTETRAVMDEMPDGYKAQVERQQRAGDPIIASQNSDLELAATALLEAALTAASEPVAASNTPEPVKAGKRAK
jgi:hypothetical protein